ncbi:MAG TPA: IPT/TIG domain-containing protein, partial [Bryobacteraceae bacterium]|nr:IPT/TIG domain-containing protein [Bryobacteraceae bacterium]
LTGLGATNRQNNLDYAQVQPTVSVGGQNCNVGYAGRAPSFAGLDQINCAIPAGVTGAAVPVIVNSNGRVSSTAFVAVQ